jgi:hypothetical protein
MSPLIHLLDIIINRLQFLLLNRLLIFLVLILIIGVVPSHKGASAKIVSWTADALLVPLIDILAHLEYEHLG